MLWRKLKIVGEPAEELRTLLGRREAVRRKEYLEGIWKKVNWRWGRSRLLFSRQQSVAEVMNELVEGLCSGQLGKEICIEKKF